MKNIGIVGAGIAGLHLGLYLRLHGVPTTVYTDKTPQQMEASRLLNAVARFDHTRQREREMGVDHWNYPDFDTCCAHLNILGDPPLRFCGRLVRPASFVDMRIYLATLLRDFQERGGWVVIGSMQAGDVADLAEEHDLVVVSSGQGHLADMFPLIPERSPYTHPQRLLCAGLYRGIDYPDPLGVSFNIAPGNGEVFQAPFHSFEGRVSSILFEAIPGGALEGITRMRYEDDPAGFEATVLDLLRDYAPDIYGRIDRDCFGLTRPLDLLQGAITPYVRRGYTRLSNGRHAVAIGDVHILNDPIVGQGANLASHSAWVLGEAIVHSRDFDESFCRKVEERIWEYAGPVTQWSNAFLQPPSPHALDLMTAAAQDQAVADAFVEGFNRPRRMWQALSTPDGTARFLRRYGHIRQDVMVPLATSY